MASPTLPQMLLRTAQRLTRNVVGFEWEPHCSTKTLIGLIINLERYTVSTFYSRSNSLNGTFQGEGDSGMALSLPWRRWRVSLSDSVPQRSIYAHSYLINPIPVLWLSWSYGLRWKIWASGLDLKIGIITDVTRQLSLYYHGHSEYIYIYLSVQILQFLSPLSSPFNL